MHIDDYERLRRRARGPLFEAQEYLARETRDKEIALCSDGESLLKQAREDVATAIESVGRVIAYVERMHGFEP